MIDLTINIYKLGIVEAADVGLVQAWVGDLGGLCRYEWAACNASKLIQVFLSHLAADYTLR